MKKILIKYPTRSRPQLFLKTLSEYVAKASDNRNNQYLISCDEDDRTMTDAIIKQAEQIHSKVIVFRGPGSNKIEACNRDIERVAEWDICLLISDDMKVIEDGWDRIIRDKFEESFPDTDGCLWFFDGFQAELCTLSCVGRKYYDQFKYLYHPSYKSFFCDNEFTDIAMREGKMKFIHRPLVLHQHPSWGKGVAYDDLYYRNDRYWTDDQLNYSRRKAQGFPL